MRNVTRNVLKVSHDPSCSYCCSMFFNGFIFVCLFVCLLLFVAHCFPITLDLCFTFWECWTWYSQKKTSNRATVSQRFWHALCFSGWTASKGFHVIEMWQNCLAAYYIGLFLVWSAWQRRGSECWMEWLPRVTTKNVLRMLGNLAVRLQAWPLDATFEPVLTCEDAIEGMFGQIKHFKRGLHGSCTTANSIQSCQLLHLRQAMKVHQARM